MGRILDVSTLNFFMQQLYVLIIKRHFAANQNVQYDAETPDIDLWPSVCLGAQDLRSRKVQRPTARAQL